MQQEVQLLTWVNANPHMSCNSTHWPKKRGSLNADLLSHENAEMLVPMASILLGAAKMHMVFAGKLHFPFLCLLMFIGPKKGAI